MGADQLAKKVKLAQEAHPSFTHLANIYKGPFLSLAYVIQRVSLKKFILKTIDKVRIYKAGRISNYMNQFGIWTNIQHACIPQVESAFQDERFLFMVLTYTDLIPLTKAVQAQNFSEAICKSIVLQLIGFIQFFHKEGKVLISLDPNFIFLSKQGGIRIFDLSYATNINSIYYSNKQFFSCYQSPESILGRKVGVQSDFYSLGVVVYEMITKRFPYKNSPDSPELIFEILNDQLAISEFDLPKDWSIQAPTFVNRLLKKPKHQRLGFLGVHQLLNHNWLKHTPVDTISKQFNYAFQQGPAQEIGTLEREEAKLLDQLHFQQKFETYYHNVHKGSSVKKRF